MTQKIIGIGVAPNDGLGDPARTAFEKVNENFTELYTKAETLEQTAADHSTDIDNLNTSVTALGAGKVDKVPGKGLSTEDFTPELRDKLAALESSRFKGMFPSLEALELAIPVGEPGDYADVDAGAGIDVSRYIWDASDAKWTVQAGTAAPLTPAQVKQLYESNPNTNNFDDAAVTKLGSVEEGANNFKLPEAAVGKVLKMTSEGWKPGDDNDTTYGPATDTAAGLMSASDKARLDAMQSKDYLLDRANHTGTQTISTVQGLQEALDNAGGGGGGNLFDYNWHNGPRTSIATGFVATDGQMLSYLAYPELCTAVWNGEQSAVEDSVWTTDDTKINCWSKGDGTSFVRVPDLNGATGRGKPFYLRGGPDGLVGTSVGDAIRNITAKTGISGNGGMLLTGTTPEGAFDIDTVNLNERIGAMISGSNGSFRLLFNASKVVPTADENRVKTAYGVMTVRVVAGVTNPDLVNTTEVLNKVNDMDLELNKFLESGAGYMFERNTWGGSRANIPVGFIPRDGQVIYDAVFPEACAAVRAGAQLAVTEAEWQADPLKRGMWSLGDGSTWLRVPDSNGMQVGSIGGLVEAGDYGGTRNGEVRNDAIRNIPGTFGTNGLVGSNGVSGAFAIDKPVKSFNNGTSDYFTIKFDPSLVVPTAEENRGKTEYGVKIIRVYGTVVNAGTVDVPALVAQMAELQASVGFTIMYPNGGTEAVPASVASNQRFVEANPFPNHHVMCEVEIKTTGNWFKPGWSSNNTAAYGVSAGMDGDSIIVQSGANGVTAPSGVSGATAVVTAVTTSAQIRLKIRKLKGATS